MLYAKSTNGFYERLIHGTNIPADAVEVTSEYYSELIDAQTQGKTIQPDDNGYPVAVDPPDQTTDQVEAQVRSERNKRAICALDAESKYNRQQNSIAKGIVVDNQMTEAEYVLVLQYAQDLFELPEQSGFPWDGPEDQLCPWPTKPDCVCDASII